MVAKNLSPKARKVSDVSIPLKKYNAARHNMELLEREEDRPDLVRVAACSSTGELETRELAEDGLDAVEVFGNEVVGLESVWNV
ncbi:hypothetical protein M7I_3929 [Glarea lozoyensis 74030]|uniref:Uncharacterized protein n=1 Tax=Glarea lozoyensis (strain ATCC 74030 / MF5533) TaxID=1104152 RepID=H0EMT2_GLAL7|nr:hypothetical protein M7I_3929 [Glarea lozoyensis 74030]